MPSRNGPPIAPLRPKVALPRSTDVFVIGGGPAGIAAAIAACRRGFSVTLADSATPPIDKACGEGLMPDALAAARDLGIHLPSGAGHPLRGIRFRGGESVAEAFFPSGEGLGIRRTELHRLMIEHAIDAGVNLCWGTHVSGISAKGVQTAERPVQARWIIGADGGRSPVRRWTGLDPCRRQSLRYGFRRHYPVAPWSSFTEVYWGDGCQIYLTPVAASEVCCALISRDPHLRMDRAMAQFPTLSRRLSAAPAGLPERGGVTASRRLKAVCRGNVALLGDASGSADAITGEGLCVSFQQAAALAAALAAGDLSLYQDAHRRLARRPEFMADLMLLLDRNRTLRRHTLRVLAAHPGLFARTLALHVGERGLPAFFSSGLALGLRMFSL
jgi:flavin-dependent dehydrogenase